jgi:hypothetical protein
MVIRSTSFYDDECYLLVSPTSVSSQWTVREFSTMPHRLMIDSGGYRYMITRGALPSPREAFERQLHILDKVGVPATVCALDYPMADPALDSNELDRRIMETIANACEFRLLVDRYRLEREIEFMAIIQGYDQSICNPLRSGIESHRLHDLWHWSKHGKLHRLLGWRQDHLAVVLLGIEEAAEVEHLDLRLGLAPLGFRLRRDPAKDQLRGHLLDRLSALAAASSTVAPSRRNSACSTALATASCALASAASARMASTVLCCASRSCTARWAAHFWSTRSHICSSTVWLDSR